VLTRQALPGESAMLSLRLIPGSGHPELILAIDQPKKVLKFDDRMPFEIQIRPSGFKTQARGIEQALSNQNMTVLGLIGMDKGFMDHFSVANEVTVSQGNHLLSRIPRVATVRAFKVFKECRDEKLAELGYDPKALDTLQSWPVPENARDWMQQAIRLQRTNATFLYRMMVTPDGRATNCTIVQSSTSREASLAACRLIEGKARFKPAVAANGESIAAPFALSTTSYTIFTTYYISFR